MSLFAALTTAVSGLTAQSNAIGNISDSLANSQTIGFKNIGTNFEALVTTSDLNVNNPGGVSATPSYQNDVQGNLIQSTSATALAVSGQGFFVVEPATIAADGSTSFSGAELFTRKGDFTLNANGYLVNSSGYYLKGYHVDSNGEVDTSAASPIQISALLADPVPTTTASYDANIPSNADDGFVSAPSTIQVFDGLGNAHDMSFIWTKTGTNEWDLGITVVGGKTTTSTTGSVTISDYTTTVPFIFNSSGNVGTIDSITSSTDSSYTVVSSSGTPAPANISFDLVFDGQTDPQTLTVNFGNYDESGGLTQFSDANAAVSVTSFSQNGIARGSFSSLSIDKNGFVSINYNNGGSKTFFQIPIAQFFAPNQLQRVTGGAYQATLQSGSARLGAPGVNGAGTVIGNALEGSTVDIADEFTQLIQAQRVYSANARTITTVNSMLDDLLNVVR